MVCSWSPIATYKVQTCFCGFNEVLKVCALQKEPHYRYQGAKPASVALDRAEPGAEDGRERDHWNRSQIPVLYYRFGTGTGTTCKTEKYW